MEDGQVFGKKSFPGFAAFAVGLAAAVPLRIYLIMFDIDPGTGFYYSGGATVNALNALLIICTAVMLLPLFIPSCKVTLKAPGHSVFAGVLSAAAAAAMAADAATQFMSVAKRLSGAGTLFASMLEFAAAAFFVIFAVSCFGTARPLHPGAALLPAIWATVRLMADFMHYTTVVNVSGYLYDMLKMVFIMIFFYYFARWAGGVPNEREARGMFAFGLPAALFSLVSALPRYIAAASGAKVTLSVPSDIMYVILAAGIISICVSIGAVRKNIVWRWNNPEA
jgi:hypothetical protein